MSLEIVNNAVTRVITRYAYFAPGILRLKLAENNTIPTARVDGVSIEINTDWFSTLTPKQRMTIIVHEWFHVMLLHHTRLGKREIQRWQRAADYEANAILHDLDAIEWIPGGLWNPDFKDLTAEKIYDLLEQDPESDKGPGPGAPGDMGDVAPHPEAGPQGPGQEPDQQKIQQIESEIKQQIAAGLQAAKMQGKESAELERLLGIMIEPAVNWKSELANFIQQTSRDDYTFKRPNVRMSGTGFVLPSLYSEKIGSLVFACDTSGSISEDELKEYSADLVSAFESVPIERLYVIWCDARINGVQIFEAGEALDLKPRGGGGTDFRPPFKYVDKECIEPAGLVYLTDGYCYSFAPEPEYPVLWCVYGNNKRFEPPYGRVLNVTFEGDK